MTELEQLKTENEILRRELNKLRRAMFGAPATETVASSGMNLPPRFTSLKDKKS